MISTLKNSMKAHRRLLSGLTLRNFQDLRKNYFFAFKVLAALSLLEVKMFI